MSTPATINFTQIREDNDLALTVERYLGPGQRGKWLCPFHKEKTPSFSIKGDRFKCFGACGISGDVVDFVALMEKLSIKEAAQRLGNGYILDLGMTPAEIKAKQAEIRTEALKKKQEREAEEAQKRKKALEKVSQMTGKVEWYHDQVGQALDYWHAQGLGDLSIRLFKLGYCPAFPIWDRVEGEYRIVERLPSYTIPYFHYGELVSIRHRLKGRDKDKYRPEFSELPNQLFNVDALDDTFGLLEPGEVILCEGEIKAMVLSQLPVSAVGLPGAQSWQIEWVSLFAQAARVYVLLDPDAEQKGREIARTFNGSGIKALNVTTPQKVDDMFVKYGCTIPAFMNMLQQGRRD